MKEITRGRVHYVPAKLLKAVLWRQCNNPFLLTVGQTPDYWFSHFHHILQPLISRLFLI